jgi:hypothetical protein
VTDWDSSLSPTKEGGFKVGGAADSSGKAIELRIDPSQLRRWHLELIKRIEGERLGRVAGLSAGRAPAVPTSVDLLLRLEGMLHRPVGPRLSDRIGKEAVERPWDLVDRPDLVLDFAGDAQPRKGIKTLRPLFDGMSGEAPLVAALLDGRAPLVEIEAVEEASIVARGLPSIENAESLAEAIEAVRARLVTMVLAAMRSTPNQLPDLVPQHALAGARAAAAFALRTLSMNAVRSLYRLCYFAPHWRVGWRFVAGPDLLDTQSLKGTHWNVLPDPGSRFYADPFPIEWQGRHFIFVEDLDHRVGKGIISAVELDENGPKGLPRPVLEEPWHLSYPFLIEHAGSVWMIPESSADRSVSLYRADPFPSRWVKEATLLSGIEASDATVLRDGERLWMFATTRDGAGSHSDTLSLFSATDLFGPWTPHAGNPVLIDAGGARPAGNVVRRGGRIWRPVQDCRRGYGSALGFAEITRLEDGGYEQVLRTILQPGHSWPGRRFHTLNRAGRLECLDGSGDSSKLKWAVGRLLGRSGSCDELASVAF